MAMITRVPFKEASGASIIERATDILARQAGPMRLGRVEGLARAIPNAGAIEGSTNILWLRGGQAAAGTAAALSFELENQEQESVELAFCATELMSESGRSIPSHQIKFDPPAQTLNAQERARIQVRVCVPLQTVRGTYSGLVQAIGISMTKAVISIEVV